MPAKLATEAPVNGGPNYEGPKVASWQAACPQGNLRGKTRLYAGTSRLSPAYVSESCLSGFGVTMDRVGTTRRKPAVGRRGPVRQRGSSEAIRRASGTKAVRRWNFLRTGSWDSWTAKAASTCP